jgi:hypothetical protein
MNIFTFFFLFISIAFCISHTPAQIYVAPDGSDSNPGTIEEPLGTIPAAVNIAQAGDTIYLRGGVYILEIPISISKDGTEESAYHLFAYQKERPILDFSSMFVNSSNRGINLSGDYWYIKGIDIKGAGDNGMHIRGSNNIIEFCAFYENRDTGLQLGNGASDNKIINCDSYFNADPGQGNADGFAPKLSVGTNNYFYGCRAWQNSDDGWDGYLREADNASTVVENSWCFANGYLKDGSPSSGNGNGYKMGGGDNGNSNNLAHNFTLINSLASDNRVKGFDQNNNRGSMTLFNCTAYRNGTNYSIPSIINSGETATVINCVALGSIGSLTSHVVQQTNSWLDPFIVNEADFISIDTTGMRGPRQPDGRLPVVNFMHLAEGSDLINAGTDVGLPFAGSAPDLGAFEFGVIIPVELSSFTVSVFGNLIILNWITASELNNYGFEVQKKFNDSYFKTIGFVQGSGTTAGINKYRFEDKDIEQGINIYRLKQIDFSGVYSYSNEISVAYNIPEELKLLQNYPNPFNPSTKFSYELVTPGVATLTIYNIIGKQVFAINNEHHSPGKYELVWNAEDADGNSLPSGIYLAKLQSGNQSKTIKLSLIK